MTNSLSLILLTDGCLFCFHKLLNIPPPMGRRYSGPFTHLMKEGRLPAYGIFKDNDERSHYDFGEMVSGLGGNDVGIIQPPFSTFPIEDKGPPYVWEGDVEDQEFVVENIPFEYTIPMLTDWELGYGHAIKGCDEHFTQIGI